MFSGLRLACAHTIGTLRVYGEDMAIIEYPRQSFDKMSRKQAITTCLALEDQRDRALAEVERLRARTGLRHRLNETTTALAERDATIGRVKALCDPETAMAAGSIGSDRYFCESDIRAAIEGTPDPIDGPETSSGWSGPIYWTDDHDGNTTRCPGCYRATHQGTCR
jgi:hypothetical protein